MRILGFLFCWSMFSMYYLVSKPYPRRQNARTIKHSSFFVEKLASHGKIWDTMEAYFQHVTKIYWEKRKKMKLKKKKETSEHRNTTTAGQVGEKVIPKHCFNTTNTQAVRKSCELLFHISKFLSIEIFLKAAKVWKSSKYSEKKVSGKKASLHHTILFPFFSFIWLTFNTVYY